MNATCEAETIGTYTVNGKTRYARVTLNPSGTWTAGTNHAMRDFARRGDAVRWLKRVLAKVDVAWEE